MTRPLHERAALITGGTSGVGLATARQLAEGGMRRIALVARNEQRGLDACAAVRAHAADTQVQFIAADANDAEQALHAAQRARELLGSVDVLVNATAAGYVPRLLHEIPIEDIAGILLEQALTGLHMSRAVLPGMREQRDGVIVNIASDAAKVPTPGETVIGAAMGAIVAFTRTLAIEAKRDGIRVNAVTPSLVEGTLMYERVMRDEFSAKLFTKARALAHLGVAQPDDLAELIVFLAGPGGQRLTGQVISVNGGISA
jgi:2-hydroxycyclohexanecarboxyl-CoA dehydrogenase